MNKPVYYLAVDIGASSGRHILSHIEDGKIVTEEIYRFPNGLTKRDGHLCWDTVSLFASVKKGMKKAAELGKIPTYMGIDTWGVDFVLVDKDGKMVGDSVGYRDGRTTGADEIFYKSMTEAELYSRTGIQKQIFNTVYQLTALSKEHPEQYKAAKYLLMMPDYLDFLLTGVAAQEYTNATTGQLVSIETGKWDYDVIEKTGAPKELFGELSMPGTTVGPLSAEIAKEVGYNLTVLHAASHDTASAVLAVPTSSDEIAYLSSGTWSLLGIESLRPLADEKAHAANLTNEGGYNYRYRCLKNIMGLWMIQSVKKECGGKYTFDELCDMAKEYEATPLRLDINAPEFLAPENMTEAIRQKLGIPDAPLGLVLSVVYHSLADCYAQTVGELSALKGKKITALHIIGGGSKDVWLNELTAAACKIPVFTGPTEATAIGNLLSQMLGTGVFADLPTARKCVFESFGVKEY